MRFNRIAMCAIVALCSMGSSGCMLVGVAAMASAQQPANNTGATTDGKQANPGIGSMAMAAVKSGAVGGPVGAGLVSQGPKLARAMFGRKGPTKPTADARSETTATAEATVPQATTPDAATASSASN